MAMFLLILIFMILFILLVIVKREKEVGRLRRLRSSPLFVRVGVLELRELGTRNPFFVWPPTAKLEPTA
eukprot:CAMPEP_0206592078 /NCGR_PEP_ID=MMETSP0325_2-20121206/40699_1 /ASSEMBLY_ACC=CAM_ASM_000347 /TAXON_ID=2866 /ORGANISM="Crypthecodinium cohnii, Strain Seligo" /LENGTH=68 /DNA_ID=CAMNT_0054101549 /DNA_START=205 /DNA_END=407 /DNA_ORIENTATION=+